MHMARSCLWGKLISVWGRQSSLALEYQVRARMDSSRGIDVVALAVHCSELFNVAKILVWLCG